MKKISDFISKVTKSERLKIEAKQNTKAITKKEDTLEKELVEVNKALAEKTAKLMAKT